MRRASGQRLRRVIFGAVVAALLLPTAARAEPVVVQPNAKEISLGLRLEHLKDPRGKWTLQDVSTAPLADKFVRSGQRVPNFGFTTAVYWFRFQLQNPAKRPTEWLLEVGYPMLDRLELWIQRTDTTYGNPDETTRGTVTAVWDFLEAVPDCAFEVDDDEWMLGIGLLGAEVVLEDIETSLAGSGCL